MRQQDDPIEAIPEENGLTLEELSAICTVQTDWLILHIEEGFLEPLTDNQNKWRFTSANLIRVRRILELERDFEAARACGPGGGFAGRNSQTETPSISCRSLVVLLATDHNEVPYSTGWV